MRSTRGKLYCILRCDGQALQTSVATGLVKPTWNEDLSFKSVQACSNLQVCTVTSVLTSLSDEEEEYCMQAIASVGDSQSGRQV